VNASTEKVFYVIALFITAKMQNQPVLPAKNGPLEYIEHIFSTTTAMSMFGRHILLRILFKSILQSRIFIFTLLGEIYPKIRHFNRFKGHK